MIAIYRKRNSLFQRGDTQWRVEQDAFACRAPDGSETQLRWGDVRWVRLRYNPSLAKPWMHSFLVATQQTRIAVDNAHFAGINDFEDRSAEYSRLVRAALERIAALSPRAQVHLGTTPLAFVAQAAFVAIALIGLAVVLIMLPVGPEVSLQVAVKLLLILAMLPLAWRWFRKNRPRTIDLDHAADDLPAK